MRLAHGLSLRIPLVRTRYFTLCYRAFLFAVNRFREKLSKLPAILPKSPRAGETWVFNDRDPFSQGKRRTVTILEIKNDWIRYGSINCPESENTLPVSLFKMCYKHCP